MGLQAMKLCPGLEERATFNLVLEDDCTKSSADDRIRIQNVHW